MGNPGMGNLVSVSPVPSLPQSPAPSASASNLACVQSDDWSNTQAPQPWRKDWGNGWDEGLLAADARAIYHPEGRVSCVGSHGI